VTRIAIAVEEIDWHEQAIIAAFAKAGTAVVPIRLSDCAFATDRPHGLAIPGCDDALPDAVFVRTVSGGSFEEVTRRLGVLHAFRELGVPVWNDARAIERCVDKSMTSFLLANAGLPTPATWTVEGIEAARTIVTCETTAGQLVLKPLFGSQGRGLRLIACVDDLPDAAQVQGVFHLQRFVPPADGFCDHRLLVCNGTVVASMTRRSESWITNVRRGGRPETLSPEPDLIDLALRSADCVGARYAGVDMMRDPDGRALVLEVNSMPAWRGLQTVTDHPIADRLAATLLRHELR
jgi:RimK family alpha-L-glutamate ligase